MVANEENRAWQKRLNVLTFLAWGGDVVGERTMASQWDALTNSIAQLVNISIIPLRALHEVYLLEHVYLFL